MSKKVFAMAAGIPFSNRSSLVLDGVDEYIDFGDNYDFGPATAFTVSMWVKPQNFAAARVFISKSSIDANVFGWVISHTTAGKILLQMRAPSQLRSFTFSQILTAGVWQHLVFTYAGGNNLNGSKVYIDSVVGSTPPSQPITNSWTHTDPLFVGKRSNSFFYSGSVNQVSIWDKALSQTEIDEVYNSGKPKDLKRHSAVANILSWWEFSKSLNFPTEVDLINSIDGTLVNMEAGDYILGDTP